MSSKLTGAYGYFTLREWRIINSALQDMHSRVNSTQDRYIINDEPITPEEFNKLQTKLPSSSWDLNSL